MKLISGGQTGADRGALEAALELGLPYGGWVPKGRRAEDGKVPAIFDQLREHGSSEYQYRTWCNVRLGTATAIICRQPPSGGSKLTIRYCREQNRPFLLLDADKAVADPEVVRHQLLGWIVKNRPASLNVAGSRESKVPGLQAAVKRILIGTLTSVKE